MKLELMASWLCFFFFFFENILALVYGMLSCEFRTMCFVTVLPSDETRTYGFLALVYGM